MFNRRELFKLAVMVPFIPVIKNETYLIPDSIDKQLHFYCPEQKQIKDYKLINVDYGNEMMAGNRYKNV